MALSLVNSFAPLLRHDHDGRSDTPVIDARNVAVNFKVEDGMVEAVKDVSFQLYRGETIAIVGESGSGKSVTARTVMGLLSKRAVVSGRFPMTAAIFSNSPSGPAASCAATASR